MDRCRSETLLWCENGQNFLNFWNCENRDAQFVILVDLSPIETYQFWVQWEVVGLTRICNIFYILFYWDQNICYTFQSVYRGHELELLINLPDNVVDFNIDTGCTISIDEWWHDKISNCIWLFANCQDSGRLLFKIHTRHVHPLKKILFCYVILL